MLLGNSSLLRERFNSHVFMCACLKMQSALGEFVSPAGEVCFPCVYVCLSKKCSVFLGNSSLLQERFNSHVFMYVCLKMQRALGEFLSPAGEV